MVEMDLPRRRSPWRIALSFLLVLAGIVGGFVAWVRHSIDRRWAEFEHEVAALVAEADARDGPRPVLRGEPEPGNVWDLYLVAGERVRASREPIGQMSSTLNRGLGLDEAERKLARRFAQEVETARAGTRRSVVRPDLFGENRLDAKPSVNDLIIYPEILGRARSRMLVEAGQPRAAADLLLDLCLMNRDLMASGVWYTELVGLEECCRVLGELSAVVAGGALSRDDVQAVAGCLERLEGMLPGAADFFRNERARVGVILLRAEREGRPLEGSSRRDWRSLFSSRARALQTRRLLEDRILEAAARESVPWTAPGPLESATARERDFLPDHGKYLVRRLPKWGISSRELRARLRLLQMACAHLTEVEVPSLEDPFGEKLRTRVEDGRLRVWSVGVDGKDNGGSGDDLMLEVTP